MATFLIPPHDHELLLRTNVRYFSLHVLGMPYESVKALIYPNPQYRAFVINKRNGSPRIIREPTKRLKQLQIKVLEFMKTRAAQAKPCVHGFVESRSIITNARRHLETTPYHLLNVDIENFFPSITFFRIRGVFRKEPFNLSYEVATVLAQLCTWQKELPQGAPTSPMLSNLVCRSLDRDLMALARRHRATYTRYADDITFSFSVRDSSRLPPNICIFDSGLVTLGYELLATIETQHHFVVNANKTRMSSRHHRLEVTGITINEFPNVKRDFIDRIRGALKAWESHGYVSAQAAWQDRVAKGRTKPYEQRAWRRQTRGGGTPELANVLWGKLLYIRMVRGKDDSIYTRLAERYNSLRLREAASNLSFTCPSLPLERIVRNARDAESATFVIEWSGDYLAHGATTTQAVFGQGTAFAYGRSEQLISCNHVLQGTVQIAGEEVTINFPSSMISNETFRAINPSTGAEYQLEIVRRDADRDLAVLKIVDEPLNHRYFVGLDAPLHRNENGFLVGYPNWSPGRTANLAEASVRNRYNRSALKRLEISQTIRQGNSGGPFVGSQFQLAGVAQQGATQTNGNDECLCVTELNAWLTTLS